MADHQGNKLKIWKATPLPFPSRYQKLQLNSEIPTFHAFFLGRCEISRQDEIGNATYRTELISEICEKLRRERRRPREVELSISWHGIEITTVKANATELIPIHQINRGMTDMERPRIFAFLSQNATTKRMECFAFGTKEIKISWAITLSLKRSFEVAYEAWMIKQKKAAQFHEDKLLSLAEDLLKSRDDGNANAITTAKEEKQEACDTGGIVYSPRIEWTQFEEDLMEKPNRRFSSKFRSSRRRLPPVREVISQPAVDNMFRERQKALVLQASVFDVGDNEGLLKAVEDERIQMLSLTGMDKKDVDKDIPKIDDLM